MNRIATAAAKTARIVRLDDKLAAVLLAVGALFLVGADVDALRNDVATRAVSAQAAAVPADAGHRVAANPVGTRS